MPIEKDVTDTIARVKTRDLFLVLRTAEQHMQTSLENIRLQLCVARKKKRRGDYLWSAARDVSAELHRLGYFNGGSSPKNSRQFAQQRDLKIRITDTGSQLIAVFRKNRAQAFDDLFMALFARHPYLRLFVSVVRQQDILAPVITSARDHISERYSAARVLADDIAGGTFDSQPLIHTLEERLKRDLSSSERTEIAGGIQQLVSEAGSDALKEDTVNFAKNVIAKLNEIVIPALFRGVGLGFDYRTHRTLWTMGQEFQLWCPVRSHPDYDGWYIFKTAKIHVKPDGAEIDHLEFDSGLESTRKDFLQRLFACYQELQRKRGGSFVPAWELRSAFCVEYRCQLSVFNKVFEESYGCADAFQIQAEIQRQKPQHEPVVRANGRNIGSIRVIKR